MSYVTCTACPSKPQCDEEGRCLNAVVTQRTGAMLLSQDSRGAVHINSPALATHPIAQANAASWPAGPKKRSPRPLAAPTAPRVGGVTATINAACESKLAGMAGSHDATARKLAAKAAIPDLLAAGVNENSAKKGAGVWARTLQSVA